METWYERLRNRRIALGLSQADLWRAVGVSNATMSDWENGKTRPKGENLSKLSKVLGVSPDWLLYGTDRKSMPNVASATLGDYRIPLISYVKAGRWHEVSDPYPPGEADDWLMTSRKFSSNTFALRIKGKSMLPRFEEGDDVIIDPSLSPRPGDFVVAKNHQEEATFKKYRPRGCTEQGEPVFELVPLNEDYATLRSDEEPVIIIGVMVEHRHYRH